MAEETPPLALTLRPDLRAALARHANKRGVTVERLIETLLIEKIVDLDLNKDRRP